MNSSSNNIRGNKTNLPPHLMLLQAHHCRAFLSLGNKKKNHTTLSVPSKRLSSVCLIMLLPRSLLHIKLRKGEVARSQVSLRDCRASKSALRKYWSPPSPSPPIFPFGLFSLITQSTNINKPYLATVVKFFYDVAICC